MKTKIIILVIIGLCSTVSSCPPCMDPITCDMVSMFIDPNTIVCLELVSEHNSVKLTDNQMNRFKLLCENWLKPAKEISLGKNYKVKFLDPEVWWTNNFPVDPNGCTLDIIVRDSIFNLKDLPKVINGKNIP